MVHNPSQIAWQLRLHLAWLEPSDPGAIRSMARPAAAVASVAERRRSDIGATGMWWKSVVDNFTRQQSAMVCSRHRRPG